MHSHNEHYQVCSRETQWPQCDRKKQKPLIPLCQTAAAGNLSFEVQKSEMSWHKPRVKPPSGSPCFERPPTGPASCGMVAAGLHRALCQPHWHHQRLCKHRTHSWAGTHPMFAITCIWSTSHAVQGGISLGHNSLKPFLMPRREWDDKVPVSLHSSHRQAGTTTGVNILSK